MDCQKKKKNQNNKTKQAEELNDAQGRPTQWKEIGKQLINLVIYLSFCYSCLIKGPICYRDTSNVTSAESFFWCMELFPINLITYKLIFQYSSTN